MKPLSNSSVSKLPTISDYEPDDYRHPVADQLDLNTCGRRGLVVGRVSDYPEWLTDEVGQIELHVQVQLANGHREVWRVEDLRIVKAVR